MLTKDEIKKRVAVAALDYVQSGMTIGIGTGTTAWWLVEALGEKVKNGFTCICVPTSKETAEHARSLGIVLKELNEIDAIDITIDGADEMDTSLNLIKGGGGALLQEKMVAAASKKYCIIAGAEKKVSTLGAFPLPVEVVPYGWKQVKHRLEQAWKAQVNLRKKHKPFVTDHGHYIIDCHFKSIPDPASLNSQLHLIPGVVETGLFVQMADIVLLANNDGSVEVL
ncbi:MAG: ribose-5-phosphate isomerase RpiA, partial [Bacteroidota bacterium]|nr:ribose-5-phosphate isomerase RpiA [Bacteroidota bacterium]